MIVNKIFLKLTKLFKKNIDVNQETNDNTEIDYNKGSIVNRFYDISRPQLEPIYTGKKYEVSSENETFKAKELEKYFSHYIENNKRRVNKIIYQNKYFEININIETNKLNITNKKDYYYSLIPHDTCKKYIMKAVCDALFNPDKIEKYFFKSEEYIKKYIYLAMRQSDNPKYRDLWDKKTEEVKILIENNYQNILKHPLLIIQIIGRLYQDADTGPLSASLHKKFLVDENNETGLNEFTFSFMNFIIELTNKCGIDLYNKINYLPYFNSLTNLKKTTNNELMQMITTNDLLLDISRKYNVSTISSPLDVETYYDKKRLLLDNYVAHGIYPTHLYTIFDNQFLEKCNDNLINVVSDIHYLDFWKSFPKLNNNFNIIAGDIIDSYIESDIKGICVIGNHEIAEVIKWDESLWSEWNQNEWFKLLKVSPDAAWAHIPFDMPDFYNTLANEFQKNFPNLKVLNNESYIYNNVRYIGLTLPIRWIQNKFEVQKYIYNQLKNILVDDKKIPTVIITHSPLFNELSMLNATSAYYDGSYNCVNNGLRQLFKEFNIIGVIHGHHHIPKSKGYKKIVKFANKHTFVVCSIYTKDNSGIELSNIIEEVNDLRKNKI